MTYFELGKRSALLANYLINQFNKNSVIAITLDRSIDLIVAIISCMKAGLPYVPLDPDYPKERLEYILEDTKSAAIITKTQFSEKFIHLNCNIIDLDTNTFEDLNLEAFENPYNP